jgi:hypothetical protein
MGELAKKTGTEVHGHPGREFTAMFKQTKGTNMM